MLQLKTGREDDYVGYINSAPPHQMVSDITDFICGAADWRRNDTEPYFTPGVCFTEWQIRILLNEKSILLEGKYICYDYEVSVERWQQRERY